MIRKKILLLGDFSVGKTSLIRRYVDGTFSDKYLSTIGVKVSRKLYDKDHEFIIWDIEGSTAQKNIPLSYYKGASAMIFVLDISREETLNGLETHKKIALSINPHIQYVVAYNKSDLLSQIQKEACDLGEYHFLTSAKDNSNIDNLFRTLGKEIFS